MIDSNKNAPSNFNSVGKSAMNNSQSTDNIAGFKIQKPINRTGTNLFDNKTPQKQVQQPQTAEIKNSSESDQRKNPTSSISIEKPSKRSGCQLITLPNGLHPKKKTVEDEIFNKDPSEIWDKIQAASTPLPDFQITTTGYIMLLNYIQEIDEKQKRGKLRRSHTNENPPRSNSTAQLVEIDSNRFVSTIYSKNVGQWDDTSDEAFKIAVNQALNSLTNKNIKSVINEILTLTQTVPRSKNVTMPKEQREKFVVETLVRKAIEEKSFAEIYSKFVKDYPHKSFRDSIVERALFFFNKYVNNPGMQNDDIAEMEAVGSARFFSSMVKEDLIQLEIIKQHINTLVDAITPQENSSNLPHSHHIEMINSFYLDLDSKYAHQIEETNGNMWEKIDLCMELPQLPKRLYFLLLDVKENRDKWINNINHEELNSKNQSSNKNKGLIRSAFVEYCESNKIPDPVLGSRDFLSAALEIFPDQTQHYFDFCDFITKTLVKLNCKRITILPVLKQQIKKYQSQQIEQECPSIWPNISTLINMFLLNNLLFSSQANEVHHLISSSVWNFENSMKWYLHDFHDFSEPVYIDSQDNRNWPLEIIDALRMPNTITSQQTKIPMSRLICVSLIRSIFQKLSTKEVVTLESLQEWKPLLHLAYTGQKTAFCEEMQYLLDELELSNSVDDVIRYVSSEN